MSSIEYSNRSIAFFVYPTLRFPRNNREYHLTNELLLRGWRVKWLLPRSGINEGVPVEEHILHYRDLDYRGRTCFLPVYLGLMLRARRIKYLWLSGWSIRADKEIYWLVRIMRMFGIDTIYDTIDPKCLIDAAGKMEPGPAEAMERSQRSVNRIYGLCRRVLSVTPEMSSLMIRKGADQSKLAVARWGSDLNVFNWNNIKGDFRRRLKIEQSATLVGWLGGMGEFKGLKGLLLPMMSRVLKDDKDVHFLIAGDGPLFNDVKNWVRDQESDSITLLGRLPYSDAAEFTASLDAYIVPTDPGSEYARAICPVKCYDAVAMGTPLVTTRTAATEHLASIADNVYLCDFDVDSFEKAIRRIKEKKGSAAGCPGRDAAGIPSHQSVSKDIADMLEDLASGAK